MVDNIKNTKKRILTAMILSPLVLLFIYCGGILYNICFLGFILIVSIYELTKITHRKKNITHYSRLTWFTATTLYTILAIFSLAYLRYCYFVEDIYCLFIAVWCFDSFAYFIGTNFGGPKLLSKVSPNKTWSGLLGGCFFTFVIFATVFAFLRIDFIIIVLSALFWTTVGFVGQIGDMLQSIFKRNFTVKDSGIILPGHGGVLDRLDSIFLAAIFLNLYYIFIGCF